MKVIAPGFKVDEGSWIEKRFMCSRCAGVVEPDQGDAHLVEQFNDRPDQKSTIVMACPWCLKSTLWREVPELKLINKVTLPDFLRKEQP